MFDIDFLSATKLKIILAPNETFTQSLYI